MFRSIASRLAPVVQNAIRQTACKQNLAAVSVRHGHGKVESDAEFDARYENFFNKPDLDSWEIRKAINDLQGHDLIPEPKIVIAALKACRRLNDYALAVRYLEALKHKCGRKVKVIWPYMMQEIRPTLDELGISTPQEMGYDKPELALEDVYDM